MTTEQVLHVQVLQLEIALRLAQNALAYPSRYREQHHVVMTTINDALGERSADIAKIYAKHELQDLREQFAVLQEQLEMAQQELAETKANRDAWQTECLAWRDRAAAQREQLNRIEVLTNQVKEAAETTFGFLTEKGVEVTIPGETGALSRTILFVDSPEARAIKVASEKLNNLEPCPHCGGKRWLTSRSRDGMVSRKYPCPKCRETISPTTPPSEYGPEPDDPDAGVYERELEAGEK